MHNGPAKSHACGFSCVSLVAYLSTVTTLITDAILRGVERLASNPHNKAVSDGGFAIT